MLEKLSNAGFDLYFTSRGLDFNGGVILRKDDLGEEFRSLNWWICWRMSLLAVGTGKGFDVRRDDGEDNTGKGFSLQQTESILIDGCWKFKMFGGHNENKK